MTRQPLTARSFFDAVLPRVLDARAHDAALPRLVATFQIVGDDGGTWTLRCERSRGAVSSEDATDAELRFIVGDRTFADIMGGALDAKTALESRAMTIQGDWSRLGELAFLFAAPKPAWARF